MATMEELKALCDLGADSEVVTWVHAHPAFAAAWQQGARGDLMMWILGCVVGDKHSDSRVALSGCALDCATSVLDQIPAGEIRERIDHAIELHRAYLADPCDCTLARTLDAAEQALSYAQSAARRAADVAQGAKASLDRANEAAASSSDDEDTGADEDADRAMLQSDAADAAYAVAATTVAVAVAVASAVNVAYAVNAVSAHAELSVPAKAREDCVNIVRRHYPEPPTIAAMQTATKGESC